jgi:hypothetical protein
MPDETTKENEIINRHLASMMTELKKAGFNAEAAVAFVVFEGLHNFNLATILDGQFPSSVTVEELRLELLTYAHNQICELIDELGGDSEDYSSSKEKAH